MTPEFKALKFWSARKGLLRALQLEAYSSGKAKNQKARRLEPKTLLEFRQAALFAYGRASLSANPNLSFGMTEKKHNEDSVDVVLRTGMEPDLHYEATQLKELVPTEVDSKQTLESLLEKIRRKYGTGETLTIAIHLNRDLVTRLGTISQPPLKGITFWLFGLDGHRIFIVRNPFAKFEVSYFNLPRAPFSLTER